MSPMLAHVHAERFVEFGKLWGTLLYKLLIFYSRQLLLFFCIRLRSLPTQTSSLFIRRNDLSTETLRIGGLRAIVGSCLAGRAVCRRAWSRNTVWGKGAINAFLFAGDVFGAGVGG